MSPAQSDHWWLLRQQSGWTIFVTEPQHTCIYGRATHAAIWAVCHPARTLLLELFWTDTGSWNSALWLVGHTGRCWKATVTQVCDLLSRWLYAVVAAIGDGTASALLIQKRLRYCSLSARVLTAACMVAKAKRGSFVSWPRMDSKADGSPRVIVEYSHLRGKYPNPLN